MRRRNIESSGLKERGREIQEARDTKNGKGSEIEEDGQ